MHALMHMIPFFWVEWTTEGKREDKARRNSTLLLSVLGMKTKMIISDFSKSFLSFFRFLCLNENDSGNRKNENNNGKNNRKRKRK
jgi:hypothetical protein